MNTTEDPLTPIVLDCPNCGKPLERVFVEEVSEITWDPGAEAYELHTYETTSGLLCHNCRHTIPQAYADYITNWAFGIEDSGPPTIQGKGETQ